MAVSCIKLRYSDDCHVLLSLSGALQFLGIVDSETCEDRLTVEEAFRELKVKQANIVLLLIICMSRGKE